MSALAHPEKTGFNFRLIFDAMRSPLLLPSLLFALAASPLGHAAIGADGLLIDRVWSGHSVPFALLVERGYQFIAYYDAELRLYEFPDRS